MTLTMYDDVVVDRIPANAECVAGYVDGNFNNFASMVRRFPHVVANHRALSITVTHRQLAMCLDIERGDATPDEASGWAKWALKAGIFRPCLYADLSTMPAVIANLKNGGVSRDTVRLWVAHYDDIPEVPKGYDGKQYTDRGPNGTDESVLLDSFFPALTPPHPSPYNEGFNAGYNAAWTKAQADEHQEKS